MVLICVSVASSILNVQNTNPIPKYTPFIDQVSNLAQSTQRFLTSAKINMHLIFQSVLPIYLRTALKVRHPKSLFTLECILAA